jgi:hypothetical protein
VKRRTRAVRAEQCLFVLVLFVVLVLVLAFVFSPKLRRRDDEDDEETGSKIRLGRYGAFGYTLKNVKRGHHLGALGAFRPLRFNPSTALHFFCIHADASHVMESVIRASRFCVLSARFAERTEDYENGRL